MLKRETLKELHNLLCLDDFIDLVSMQTTLHSFEPAANDFLEPGAFSERVIAKFQILFNADIDRAKLALNRLMRACDFETASTLKGLGNNGNQRSLKSLIEDLGKKGLWEDVEVADA